MLYEVPPKATQQTPPDAWVDSVAEMFYEQDDMSSTVVCDNASARYGSNISSTTTLAYRPGNLRPGTPRPGTPRAGTLRPSTNPHLDADSSSDEDGFTLVHRPRQAIPATGTPDQPMSSPELTPCAPIDVLAATGSDYPSDDDWSMV